LGRARRCAASHCGQPLDPEVDTETLAEALGARYGLDPARMAFGPGSGELLGRIVNTFVGPGEELVHSQNAYLQFPIYARFAGTTPTAADDCDFHDASND